MTGCVSCRYLVLRSVAVFMLIGGGAAEYKSTGGWDEARCSGIDQ